MTKPGARTRKKLSWSIILHIERRLVPHLTSATACGHGSGSVERQRSSLSDKRAGKKPLP